MAKSNTNTPVNPYVVAISVLLPSFLSLAASSATNVCQPNIAGFYGATQYEANTVITCYIISAGLMLPVTGYLVQVIGKKLLFYYSLWIFALGCLLCIIGSFPKRTTWNCNEPFWCSGNVLTFSRTFYGWIFDR